MQGLLGQTALPPTHRRAALQHQCHLTGTCSSASAGLGWSARHGDSRSRPPKHQAAASASPLQHGNISQTLSSVEVQRLVEEARTRQPQNPADIKPIKERFPDWPRKASMYILRTDGKSCSRELVTGNGKLHFAYPSTQQHLLVWRNRPRSVMVLKKLGDELLDELLEVLHFLGAEQKLHVLVEPHVYTDFMLSRPHLLPHVHTYTEEDQDRLAELVDFIVCLGGDGVILHASHLFKHHIPPVMAFNLGSLGFLANSSWPEFRQELGSVLFGSQRLDSCSMTFDDSDGEDQGNTLGVMVTLRMRLLCEVVRRGQTEPEQVHEVMNEVVIDRGSSSFLTNIECYEKGRFITRVQADGIMLATPTGSTAYSVAAGGSMVHPNVPAILLTPVCPHTLSFRPIILPDYAELELRIPDDARCTAWVCFDGRGRQELARGDAVRVRMSENPMPTINKTDLTGDWFDSLERCFKWSDRTPQKPLPASTIVADGGSPGMNGHGDVY